MSIKDYYLKFMKFSTYASSVVSNSRDEMSRFVTGVFEDVVEDRQANRLNDNVNLGRLMLHAQLEESCLKRRFHEGKKPKAAN